jgi:monofunctional glycosyltransferase
VRTREDDLGTTWWGGTLLTWVKRHKIRTVLLFCCGLVIVEALTIPFFSISRLRTERPGETALMRQRNREAKQVGRPLKFDQRWIPLSSIPKHAVEAVVVAEDGTFYSHGGFDWYEVQESLERNLNEGRAARGASTITQQLAKNLYLSTSKDPIRKIKEGIITVLLEKTLSKGRILELYLNVIEWGRGIFGIESASRTYFGKSASDLTLDEATRLAAVIPSPLRHRPDADSRYVLRRKEIIYNRMTARAAAAQPSTREDSSKPTSNREAQGEKPRNLSDGDVTDSTESEEGIGYGF